MPFDPFTIDLPVRDIIPAVREHLAAQNTLIVNAPPGGQEYPVAAGPLR
ncbi:hypothetical protein FHS90_001922 [Rufibacter quisquiliarum]|uniref:Uncharacterized protein n=1 Tax=Rufibacter quisquiliarum TaxID=1549639 RepID=A0A839GTU8_9BACT|nr:hypothetical protein [Rufibacter quisquiliarum]MBA9077211.1 hypothetical protein [Rufibacter quisquiliarum]